MIAMLSLNGIAGALGACCGMPAGGTDAHMGTSASERQLDFATELPHAATDLQHETKHCGVCDAHCHMTVIVPVSPCVADGSSLSDEPEYISRSFSSRPLPVADKPPRT